MKTLLLAFGVSVVLPLAGRAQTPAQALPSSVGSFFKEDFTPSDWQDSTAYCAETTYRDSVAGVTRVYYPSGQLKQFVPYANVKERVLYGTLTTWYENGMMRTKEDYVAGKRHGDLLTYYPDGTLRRRDRYVTGRSGLGSCYGPNGVTVPYFAYEQLPLYPGGDVGLIAELARGVRLNPQEMNALRKERLRITQQRARMLQRPPTTIKLEILVELLVAEDGRIAKAQVVHSNAFYLNNAALRSVEKLKRQFVPARRDGDLVASHFVVPIYFNLVNLEMSNGEQPPQLPRPFPVMRR